jgi:hypothetical protein
VDASVVIDPTAHFQEIFGFGGAISESATHVFGQLAPADQAALLDERVQKMPEAKRLGAVAKNFKVSEKVLSAAIALGCSTATASGSSDPSFRLICALYSLLTSWSFW